MHDLIARLEAASEGSRELDAEIECYSMGTRRLVRVSRNTGAYVYLDDRDRRIICTTGAEHYSTSLDAALSLVPEGWPWGMSDDRGRTPAHATVVIPADDGEHVREEVIARASTPALALCIAALRARAALAP